jgi:uncharacterized OsmC-like protein
MKLKKHLTYGANAKWNHKTGGTATINGFTQDFDTPKEHGGNETAPCPDQLFMTSLAGCVVTTFNYYRKVLNVETKDLIVKVSSNIELETNGYRITGINIRMQVWSNQEYSELNKKCAKRALEYCHLTKSIEHAIPITSTIRFHAL